MSHIFAKLVMSLIPFDGFIWQPASVVHAAGAFTFYQSVSFP
ncbi:hypothetical protein [Proteus terrae]